MTHPLPNGSLAVLDSEDLPPSVWLPKTIAEILEVAADRNRGGIVFHPADGSRQTLTYPDLRALSFRALDGVQAVSGCCCCSMSPTRFSHDCGAVSSAASFRSSQHVRPLLDL